MLELLELSLFFLPYIISVNFLLYWCELIQFFDVKLITLWELVKLYRTSVLNVYIFYRVYKVRRLTNSQFQIVVPNPDVRGRQEILELYLQDKPLVDDVDIKAIARGTPGFNGAGELLFECFWHVHFLIKPSYSPSSFLSMMFTIAICSFKLDLANLVNIAAIKAAVEGAEKLTAAQLEFAKDRIIMGTERKTMFISDESKKVCEYVRKLI